MAQIRYRLRSGKTNWKDLSCELWYMVLDEVARTNACSSRAAYACICRDWQEFFEKFNFGTLVLKSSDLPQLSQIVVGRRRELVKHIALDVNFGLNATKVDPKLALVDEKDLAFSHAIWSFWQELSTWQRKRDVNDDKNGQLTVELLLECSPDEFNPGRTHPSDTTIYSSFLRRNSLDVYEQSHGPESKIAKYRRSLMVKMQEMGSFRDEFRHFLRTSMTEGMLTLDFQCLPYRQTKGRRRLPQVDVITNFLIRREYYRNFDPWSLCRIIQSLPLLETINLERSFFLNAGEEQDWNKVLVQALMRPMPHSPPSHGGNNSGLSSSSSSSSPRPKTALPGSLKRLTLFSEVRETFYKQSAMPMAEQTHQDLPGSLAMLSRNLQELSVSFLVDAEDFFRSVYWPSDAGDAESEYRDQEEELQRHLLDDEPRWEHLTSLALTSKRFITQEVSLQPSLPSSVWTSRINELLLAAAVTAKMMPKLEVMEIWNGDKMQAGIFRYVSGAPRQIDPAKIVWQGTEPHPVLSDRVLEAWNEVAVQHNPRNGLSPSVRMISIEPSRIEGTACVLEHLRLTKLVMHEVSAWQGQWEQRN